MLGLSQELGADLMSWLKWWQEHAERDDDDADGVEEDAGNVAAWGRWREDGARLLDRLRDELGPGFEVSWV
jgi:hypothetical protein